MPCYHPLKAWRSYQVNASGKRSLTFSPDHAFGDSFPLPCGRCIGCRLEHSRQWAVRCLHESQLHQDNCFLTLTLDDDHLVDRHWTGRTRKNGDPVLGGTLLKKHWQDFMKRLRKKFPGRKLGYFHCGEYGDQERRPHYHAVMFNLDFEDKIFWQTRNGHPLYISETLSKTWGMGHCSIGAVTFESAAYVARYVCKKITGQMADAHYTVVDHDTGEIFRLLSEYTTMSLKPAIAKTWGEKFLQEVYSTDSVVVRGKEMKPPRIYDRLLETADTARYEILKEDRLSRARERSQDSTPERLKVREEVKISQMQTLKREIE